MRTGEHKIARSYVIYRADRTRMREQRAELQQPKETIINVTFEDGHQGPLDTARLDRHRRSLRGPGRRIC